MKILPSSDLNYLLPKQRTRKLGCGGGGTHLEVQAEGTCRYIVYNTVMTCGRIVAQVNLACSHFPT